MAVTCKACGKDRAREDAVRVTSRLSGAVWYVCRPTLDGSCFRSAVGTTDLHAISQPSMTLPEKVAALLASSNREWREMGERLAGRL